MASAVILSCGKMRSRPVCTLVAVTNSCRVLPRADRLEIDEAFEQVLQRVDVERIEVVGREILRHRLDPDAHRRIFQRQEREQPVDRLALHVWQSAAEAGRAPEIGKALARFLSPAAHQSVGQQHGIDRAGRGAGDAFDLEPAVFQQMIEHAPGEGAVRAAALQREIDALGRERGGGSPRMARTMDLIIGKSVSLTRSRALTCWRAKMTHCATQPPSIE